MNKRRALYITIPFVAIIFSVFALHIFTKDIEVSDVENRTLEQLPTTEDMRTGQFQSKFETYVSDQFPFRDTLSNLYSNVQVSLGKDKIKNYYVLDNNFIMPTPSEKISDDELKSLANKINEYAKVGINEGKKVYYTVTPHKESMLNHLYPKYTKNLDTALSNSDLFKSYLDDDINILDMSTHFLNDFTNEERENLYFKTDHHWNGVGAFYGFNYMLDDMNIDNTNLNDYMITNHDKGKFIGSYNKNLNNLVKEDEIISYVHLKDADYDYYKFDGKKDIKGTQEDFVGTRLNEDEILYGGAYMFGNACSILKMRNEDALIDEKIMVIRDSYQAPTSWLFADIFSEVQLVDPRYIQNIDMTINEIIKNSDADILMFMYNTSDFKVMIDTMN